MAYSDCSDDAALRAAWRTFCRRLEAAGDKVFKDYIPTTPEHRADGFRYLMQNLGQAFDLGFETKDPRYPVIHAFNTPYCHLGGDCAEFIYQQAWIDGENVYRVSGNRGSAPFLNFTVYGPHLEKQPDTGWPTLHEPFGDIPEANFLGSDLKTSWNGSFELYIGGPERDHNWMPTTPDSTKLFIRQGFDTWNELPATMRIERVGMDTPRPLPQPAELIRAMDWSGRFVEGLMSDWPDHCFEYNTAGYLNWINEFPPDLADVAEADARRGRAVTNMTWVLSADEALIIEFEAHPGMWSVTNMGPFFISMDYLYRSVSWTRGRARIDSDGMVRVILAPEDPGYHNWLDTQGFKTGNVTYRNVMSTHLADLRTRVVKLADLARALPAHAARVTPEQRAEQLRERFDGIRRRYLL